MRSARSAAVSCEADRAGPRVRSSVSARSSCSWACSAAAAEARGSVAAAASSSASRRADSVGVRPASEPWGRAPPEAESEACRRAARAWSSSACARSPSSPARASSFAAAAARCSASSPAARSASAPARSASAASAAVSSPDARRCRSSRSAAASSWLVELGGQALQPLAPLGVPRVEHRRVGGLVGQELLERLLQPLALERPGGAALGLVLAQQLALLLRHARELLVQLALGLGGAGGLQLARCLEQLLLARVQPLELAPHGLERLERLVDVLQALAVQQDREEPLQPLDGALLALERLHRLARLDALAGGVHQLLERQRAGLLLARLELLEALAQELQGARAALLLQPRQQRLHRAPQALELAQQVLLLVGDGGEVAALVAALRAGTEGRGAGRESQRRAGQEDHEDVRAGPRAVAVTSHGRAPGCGP